jgi:2,3-diketo-5-methylthio-1-phosphopentane phosphatase
MNFEIKKLIVFSDFDGSFVEKDIGHRLYTHFSGRKNLSLVDRWKQMKISSRECILKEAALIENITLKQLHSFLDQFRLRPGAKELYRELKAKNVPFFLVSDGFDLYIDYILKKHGLNDIEVFCNGGKIDNGRLAIEFPYENYDCRRCGNCKGARIRDTRNNIAENRQIAFIGDGLSDICAAPEADLIFARGDFLAYCRREGLKPVEYKNFFDILNYLKKLGML